MKKPVLRRFFEEMRAFRILLKKEIAGFFLSPMTYVVAALWALISGISFLSGVDELRNDPRPYGVIYYTFNHVWFWIPFLALFPLITMRCFAEEKKSGALETLLTAPVRTSQIVLAKYLATVVFFVFLWTPGILCNLLYCGRFVEGGGGLVPEGFWSGYALVLLMGLMFLGVGCFASTLTDSQMAAAMICFSCVFVHYFLGILYYYASDLAPGIIDRKSTRLNSSH